MFPIPSLTPSTATNVPAVNRAAEASTVDNTGINAVGSALDAPPAASVQVELSPVASFLLAVTNAQAQLTQTQQADTINAAVQDVVNAFNLLPSVDSDPAQPEQTSLLNELVNNLNQPSGDGTDGTTTQAQNLARLGVTLQPPPLPDLTSGLSLQPELLRAALNADDQQTTTTLQNTLSSFREQATQYAERLAAAQAPTNMPADLRNNPALAAAIAAYHIVDVAGAAGRAAPVAQAAIPPVAAVSATTPSRAIGTAPN
ncbi:hypothetical protein GTP44_04745 [Duganella sp. FT50W]|uniref:Uncharacterized protein n=1 Tax=Duganella lactea TaxID=2692173 RepID=A0A6L8ME86_9BURK|nr:hypothetical protein [Duganella lactea]MYM81267.1 hypothetical protein [Duganella lactea]